MTQVYGDSTQLSASPSLSSGATAYAAGDQLGGVQTLAAGYAGSPRGGLLLQHLAIIDEALEGTGVDIMFFSGSPTLAADNATFTGTFDDMASFFVGKVSVSSTSYYTAGSAWVVSQENIGLYIKPDAIGTVYAVPVVKSATTYTSQALTFKYSFYRDK